MKKISAKLISCLLAALTACSLAAAPVSAASAWTFKEGSWYHLNQQSQPDTGWIWDDGWYWAGSDGKMQTGWVRDNGWYHMDSSGRMQTGWVWDNGWYHLGQDGRMDTGWLWDNGWYWLDAYGKAAQNSFVTLDGKTYAFDTSGRMRTGWISQDGKWYYFQSGGQMHHGLLELADGTYYLGADGSMTVGAVELDDQTMIFGADGKLTQISPQITFGTPRGWVTGGGTGGYLLLREDMQNANILVLPMTSTGETPIVLPPENIYDDPDTLAQCQQIIHQVLPTAQLSKLTSVPSPAHQGLDARSFEVDVTVAVTDGEMSMKILQTVVQLDEKTLVYVQLTAETDLFEGFRSSLEKVLETLTIA